MSRGAHAAPKSYGPAVQAARTALVRSSALTGALALSWAALSVADGAGPLDAIAADESTTDGVGGQDERDELDAMNHKIEALNAKYRCSSTLLDDGVIPARTVVRMGDEVRLATFDEGWAMHLGDVPGTLVSVCAR